MTADPAVTLRAAGESLAGLCPAHTPIVHKAHDEKMISAAMRHRTGTFMNDLSDSIGDLARW
jgi:hypothetical protein